jgi:GNAT superfamily N-acetyltransferase
VGLDDVRLRDGRSAVLRPLRPDDADGLGNLLGGLSLQSRAFRFFSGGASPQVAARAMLALDPESGYSVVAEADGRLVGHGMYARWRPDGAEVALEVADDWQGVGLGTVMLAHLGAKAAEAGFETVEAVVMPDNRKMLDAFHASGVPCEITSEPGVVHVRTLASAWTQ